MELGEGSDTVKTRISMGDFGGNFGVLGRTTVSTMVIGGRDCGTCAERDWKTQEMDI
jgi:hypothetical protein